MEPFTLGTLTSVGVSQRPDLLGASTCQALVRAELFDEVGVVAIDPALSDTAATQAAFELPPDTLANCVLVSGKREGVERIAACVVLATTRVDVNGIVKRYLDVRKASFLPTDRAVALSTMEYGGITPIGLPAAWPLLIDHAVIHTNVVVIGSGIRRSKILLPGALLGRLPHAKIMAGLWS